MLEIESVIHELTPERIRKSPNGVSASFVQINNEWGVKVFTSESTRDYSYKMQHKASLLGLAPHVGEKFDLGEGQYCMICEVVEVFQTQDMSYEDERAVISNRSEEIKELKKILVEEIGFHFYDDHLGNYGLINDRLVCIDFGEVS